MQIVPYNDTISTTFPIFQFFYQDISIYFFILEVIQYLYSNNGKFSNIFSRTKYFPLCGVSEIFSFSDDHINWFAEDRPSAAAGASGSEDRPLLRVRGSRPHPPHVRLRLGGSLAGLHLVRHWICWESGAQGGNCFLFLFCFNFLSEGPHRLAGRLGKCYRSALHGK